jgi:hypothetical protein
MPQWMQELTTGWPMIRANLPTFAVILVLMTGAIWVAINWSYSGVLASKNGQIELQDRQLSDYREKLKGASPEEAKAKIDSLEEQTRGARSTNPPISSAKASSEPSRFYSTGDKERLSEAFYKLAELLNKPVTKIEQDSQGLIRYWDGVKSNPDRNHELKNIISQLEALRTLSGSTYAEFSQLAADYKSYSDILADIMQDPPVERERALIAWQYAVNDFHRGLTTFDSLQTTVQPRTLEELGLLINPTQDKFRDAAAKLNDWILQCNKRIKQKELAILK